MTRSYSYLFRLSLASYEATGEVPLSFSEPEQGVHAVDPGVGASSTSFDEAEASPHVDIPSSAALIGKSFLITLPTVPDMGSRPTEYGESSSEPSRQFARKVLKRVLSSWFETLFLLAIWRLGSAWLSMCRTFLPIEKKSV